VKTLALIGLLWLCWSAYAFVSPESEDELPHRVAAGERGDIDLVDVLARHLQVPVTQGNRIELLSNGDEIFPPMIAAIDGADSSVRLLSYVWWTGDIATRMAQRLVAAAERGVAVRLILDAWGGRKIEQGLLDDMEAAGVQLAWFHPFDWRTLRRLNQRTHRKILVVDDVVAFAGGVGIAAEWSGDARSADEWRDNHFRITGPAVRYLDGSFAENWLNATGELLLADEFDDASVTSGGQDSDRIALLSTSPRGDISPIALSYWTALTMAADSVDIASPYFVPDRALAQAVIDTAERGVRVRLLLPGDHNDSTLVRLASRSYYPELLQAGVQIYQFDPTMTHTKLVITDRRWSLVGSANFDNRSFELNDEIVMLLDAPAMTERLQERYEADLARATRIRWEERALADRIVDYAAHAVLLLREQL